MSTQLGKSEKLGLSGRPKKRVGILSTSKVYEVNNEIVIFYPEFSSVENFWIVSDPQMLTERIKTELYETIIDRPLKAEEIQSILSKPCDDIILDIFTKRYRKCSTKKYRSSLVFDPFVVTGSLLLEF